MLQNINPEYSCINHHCQSELNSFITGKGQIRETEKIKWEKIRENQGCFSPLYFLKFLI